MNLVGCFILLLSLTTAAMGQGQFVFNNRLGSEVNAKFQLPTDVGSQSSLVGDLYTVQILGGPSETPLARLTPLGITDFRVGAAAGFVNPLTLSVPGVVDGRSADILLRFFEGNDSTGIQIGQLGPFTTTVAEAPNIPPNLYLGTNPLVISG